MTQKRLVTQGVLGSDERGMDQHDRGATENPTTFDPVALCFRPQKSGGPAQRASSG
jgi:hypothetical protein